MFPVIMIAKQWDVKGNRAVIAGKTAAVNFFEKGFYDSLLYRICTQLIGLAIGLKSGV